MGGVQASAAGIAVALGGLLRDAISYLAMRGALGPVLHDPAIGYIAVYHLEILLLFVTLVAIGPLVRAGADEKTRSPSRGLLGMPASQT